MQTQKTTENSVMKQIPRSFWISVAVVATYSVGFAIWTNFGNDLSSVDQMFKFIWITFGICLAFALSWVGMRKRHQKQESGELHLPHRLPSWLPLIFSATIFLQCVGNILFGYYVNQGGFAPFPSWGDAALLGMYPVMMLGVFLLPTGSSSMSTRLRGIVDSLLIIIALLTFSWYFLLGPELLYGSGGSLLAIVTHLAYPGFDLLLISWIIFFNFSTTSSLQRLTISLLSLALVIFTLADSFHQYQVLQHIYSLGKYTLGWPLGNCMVALAIQTMRWLPKRKTATENSLPEQIAPAKIPLWRTLLPYLLVPAVVVLLSYVWNEKSNTTLTQITYYCGLLLIALVFVKQFISLREIHWLNKGLQNAQQAIKEKNEALGQANARLEAIATTDPLTELPNHRALVTLLDQELDRSQQYQRNCSLLFLDLDHFKALNDGYGHAGGDAALHEFASVLRTQLPLTNTVGRWGGEEFLAILPEVVVTDAAKIAEELRRTVANHTFSVGGGMHLTCSIGLACYPLHRQQREALLEAADSAMYGAKRLGRNQVRLIDDPAVKALLEAGTAVEGRDEVALLGMVQALALLVDQRDSHTGEHSRRVGTLLLQLAQELGLPSAEASLLSLAGQLHDVGKTVIPDSILQKREALTEQDTASIERHSQVGADVVSCIPSLRPLVPIILAHHERWDGTGYPNHLAGEEIPSGARLLAVIDAYVVMTTGTIPPSHTPEEALAELQSNAGTQFAPEAVQAFSRLIQREWKERETLANVLV